ncbi:MAG TPA: mannosyltransferase family protein, partial [Ktedonobacteraceae bacterium]|nr:mannosyltransferase family protein [Ktedonobacteraceae bacterium]
MFKQKEAWKEAAWVFAMSRLMIILISFFCVGFFSHATHKFSANCEVDAFCIYYHWDVVHYVDIAFYGYRVVQDTGFFPLWPLILHGVGWLLGGSDPLSYIIAGLLVANICFYFALVFLYRLVSEEFEQSVARRALYYFAFSPFSFFFFLAYTESLFVMLCIATFLLLRYESRWAWLGAGLLGFLATMTRSSGLALAVPFLVIGLRDGLRLHFEQASFSQW